MNIKKYNERVDKEVEAHIRVYCELMRDFLDLCSYNNKHNKKRQKQGDGK